MGRRSWVWNEDVATNGGIAAVAAALAAGNRGHELSGTDAIVAPNRENCRITSVLTADETPITASASGYVTVGSRNRAFQLPLVKGDGTPGFMSFANIGGLRVPKGVSLNCLANASGAGAEQHIVVLNVEDPEYRGLPIAKPMGKTKVVVTMATGAIVAQTLSGFVDICGRTNAYTNSIRAIADTKDITVQITKLGGILGAGYSGYVLRDKGGDGQLVFPGVATHPVYYDLVEMLGNAPTCKADEPLQLGGIGVSTAAQTAWMELLLSGPGVTDLD